MHRKTQQENLHKFTSYMERLIQGQEFQVLTPDFSLRQ